MKVTRRRFLMTHFHSRLSFTWIPFSSLCPVPSARALLVEATTRIISHRHEQRVDGGGGCGYGLYENRMKMMEVERLEAVLKERTEVFEMLLQNEKELQENTEKAQQLQKAYDMLLKERESNDAVRKSQRERAEVFQTDAEIERLEKDYTELTARKHKLTCEVQKYSSAKEFMDCICKIIKFKDTDALVDYIDSVKYIRGQLLQREEEMQEQIDMQRKALLSLHEKHSLVMLQKNNKLSQLQSELEKARSDALAWEKEWNHIQETSAKKILTLGQIKMATLNLYEMTGAEVGEEGVDMNDTETQLDHTKMFLEVHRQIVKQYNVQ